MHSVTSLLHRMFICAVLGAPGPQLFIPQNLPLPLCASTLPTFFRLYNSRSPETAALHVALGDRHPLDVARVDTLGGQHKYFVCQAAYGFLGDVMSMSEGMRALGPSR